MPSPYACVHVSGIDFDQSRFPVQILATNQRGPRAPEWIEHNTAVPAAIANRAPHQIDGFHRRMKIVAHRLVHQPYVALVLVSAPIMFRPLAPSLEDRLILTLIIRTSQREGVLPQIIHVDQRPPASQKAD